MSELRTNRIVPRDGLPSGSSGGIIQVKQTVKTDTFSKNSSSWADITGMSVSITPTRADSKVFVMVDIKIGTEHGDSDFQIKLVRGSTDVYVGDTDGNRTSSSMGTSSYGMPVNDTDGQYYLKQVSLNYLDSPSTTSSTTYKLQIINFGGRTNYVNRTGNDNNSQTYPRTASSITVMEVSG